MVSTLLRSSGGQSLDQLQPLTELVTLECAEVKYFLKHIITNNFCVFIIEIHGTDGQQFHPLLTEEQDLWLFTPDLCRSVIVSYTEDRSISGINTRHFEASLDNFNLTMDNNLCYCQNVRINFLKQN